MSDLCVQLKATGFGYDAVKEKQGNRYDYDNMEKVNFAIHTFHPVVIGPEGTPTDIINNNAISGHRKHQP